MEKVVTYEFTVDVLTTNIPDDVTAEIDLSLGELVDRQVRSGEVKLGDFRSPLSKFEAAEPQFSKYLARPEYALVSLVDHV